MSTQSFVKALRRALDGKTRLDVAIAADVTPGAIGNWLSGTISSPDPAKVFAVERALGLSPGHLSRHLGYIPNEALEHRQPVHFDEWLAEHGDQLSGRQRDLLTGVYDEFVAGARPHEAPNHEAITASVEADRVRLRPEDAPRRRPAAPSREQPRRREA